MPSSNQPFRVGQLIQFRAGVTDLQIASLSQLTLGSVRAIRAAMPVPVVQTPSYFAEDFGHPFVAHPLYTDGTVRWVHAGCVEIVGDPIVSRRPSGHVRRATVEPLPLP